MNIKVHSKSTFKQNNFAPKPQILNELNQDVISSANLCTFLLDYCPLSHMSSPGKSKNTMSTLVTSIVNHGKRENNQLWQVLVLEHPMQ